MEKPWIDLFATKQSYVSHVPDGRTYSVDALTTHWGGTWAYAYPPQALLPKILSKDYIVLLIAQLSVKLSGSKLCEAYQLRYQSGYQQTEEYSTSVAMYSIPSRKPCVFMSWHYLKIKASAKTYILLLFVEDISNSIYLTTLLKNYRQRQN